MSKRPASSLRHPGIIARLPWTVRQQINPKLRDNRCLKYVAQWLFEQIAPDDLPELGLAKGETFARIYASKSDPLHSCLKNLSNYRNGLIYRAWLEDEKRIGLVGSVIANFDAIEAVGGTTNESTTGISRFALSVIIEKLEKVAGEDAAIEDLTSLTKAIATLNSGLVANRKAEIDLRKLALLEKKAAAAQSVSRDPQMTPEEKQQRLKEIFGIA